MVIVVVLTEVGVYLLMWSIKCKNKFLQRKSVVLFRLNLCFCCYQQYCYQYYCLLGWMLVGKYSLGDKISSVNQIRQISSVNQIRHAGITRTVVRVA